MSQPGEAPSRGALLIELLAPFALALGVIAVGWRLVPAEPLARQAVVWVANVVMLATLWVALRVRGQSWRAIGLPIERPSGAATLRGLGASLAVLVAAVVAFVLGSLVAGPLVGTPEPAADLSSYTYLAGNLPLLIVALAGVYLVSSFGEEVVYRGFVITRVESLVGDGRTATGVAAVVSAVVFGAAHFDWGVIGIIQTTFLGAALAGAFLLLGRNLWPLILAHAYLDTILLVQQYLAPGGGPP
jgi:membrane protease YdiL (CAAX protease family)